MTLSWRTILLGGLALLLIGAGTAWCWGDAKIEALQHLSDSTTTAALRRDSAAKAQAVIDSATIDSLQRSKVSITIDSTGAAEAAAAVKRAKTASDSNVALVRQVAHLEGEIAGYRKNKTTDSLSLLVAQASNRMLRDSLSAQTLAIVRLNTEIQRLTPKTPKWVKTATYVATAGGFFVAGVQCVKNQIC